MAPTTDGSGDGPPRSLLIAAVAVAVTAIVAVLAIALVRQSPSDQQPVPIASVPAPRAESPECGALMAALPDELGDYRRAPAADPAPTGRRRGERRPMPNPSSCGAGWTARPNSSSVHPSRSSTPCSGSRSATRAGVPGSPWTARYISPDAAARVGPNADPADFRGVARTLQAKPVDAGPPLVSAGRCLGRARCPPSPPARSGSPCRWRPTSSDTSKSW